jgi:hypothetical protein
MSVHKIQHLNLMKSWSFEGSLHGFTPSAARGVFVRKTLLEVVHWLIIRRSRLLSHAIQTHVLDPALLPTLLRTARAALFPNNTLAPPRMIPSASEQLFIRQRCARTILSLIPAKIQDIYFGPDMERTVKEVEEVLDTLGDSYCNKHLLYGVVELIIVRLIPELSEKGVKELLDERLSS